MAVAVGIDAQLWYRTWDEGGTPEYGTWYELENVRNVTVNLSSSEADVTVRANSGWRATVPTLKDASVDFEMVYDTADTNFVALRSRYFAGTPINVRVLDGYTAAGAAAVDQDDGAGLDMHARIVNFSINQSNEEAITVSVSLKPTYVTDAADAPKWVVDGV